MCEARVTSSMGSPVGDRKVTIDYADLKRKRSVFQSFTRASGPENNLSRIGQCRAGALQERRVVAAGAFEPEDGRRKIAVAPRWRYVVEVLQGGGAEFVIVRIVAFREDQPTGGRHQRRELIASCLQKRQRL